MKKVQKACADCFNNRCLHRHTAEYFPFCPADPYVLEMPWQEESWTEGP